MIATPRAWLFAGMAGLIVSWSGLSWSQERYPGRLIRIVTAQGPGAATDVLARFLAEHLRRDLKAEFIVENKPGGGEKPLAWRLPAELASREADYEKPVIVPA